MYKWLFILVLLFLYSCSDEEDDKLRESIKEEIAISATDSISTNKIITIEQYKDVELAFNKKYIKDLRSLIEGSFEKQLDSFDDEELGFWASYGYMIDYLFKSDQEWEDEMLLKSQKYFSTLDIEQDANSLFESYVNEINRLRSRFVESNNYRKVPQFQSFNLPDRQINIMGLKKHAERNLIIEIGEGFLKWFLVVTVVAFISFVIGLAKPPVWIATVIMIILSCILTYRNDNKLLDSLRAQESSIIIDYNSINKTLDANTSAFYEISDKSNI